MSYLSSLDTAKLTCGTTNNSLFFCLYTDTLKQVWQNFNACLCSFLDNFSVHLLQFSIMLKYVIYHSSVFPF